MYERFQCGGKELAKVLYYYGLIPSTVSSEQQIKIVCPFHDDVNPSMVIDLYKGTFFCFGCECSGDAFSFVKKVNEEKNDLEACLEYCKILRSDKVKKLAISIRTRKKKCSRQAYVEAYDYYHGLSKVNWEADDSEEVAEAKEYMLHRGFEPQTLCDCKAKVTYNNSYPIIFPMLDNGKFKGWVCRTDKPQVEKKRKYLYNEGFIKQKTLVGTYGNKEYLFVVEGYMDRLKMMQNLEKLGLEEDVVAILGWKMSSEQEKKIKDSGVKYIISALDNDECGKKGTQYLKTRFLVTRFCYLKSVKDPGEMGVEHFKKMYMKTMKVLAQDKQKR